MATSRSKSRQKNTDEMLSIQQAMDMFNITYDQVYRMIRKDQIRYKQQKRSNTRPIYLVNINDIQVKLNKSQVTANDLDRLRAEKLAVDIRLKQTQVDKRIEEIRAQEEGKYLRQTRWIFGDMRSWPELLDFSDEQREQWNEVIERLVNKLEEIY